MGLHKLRENTLQSCDVQVVERTHRVLANLQNRESLVEKFQHLNWICRLRPCLQKLKHRVFLGSGEPVHSLQELRKGSELEVFVEPAPVPPQERLFIGRKLMKRVRFHDA